MSNQSQRPKITVPLSSNDTMLEIISAAGIAMMILITAKYWSMLPARIPSHFGFSGQADAWGPKSTMLILPGLGLLSYALMTVVTCLPWTFNYPVPITPENAERQYRIAVSMMRWLKTEIVLTLVYIEWEMIRVALGRAQGLSAWFGFVTLAAILTTTLVMYVQAQRAR